METGVDFLSAVRQAFPAPPVDLRSYSPLALAFLGDGVYDLAVRSFLVDRGNRSVARLDRAKSRYARAGAQALVAEALQEKLTPDEQAVYRRGRNANLHSHAKNATIPEYRRATGLEALCGYWYLRGECVRMFALLREGFGAAGLLELEETGADTGLPELEETGGDTDLPEREGAGGDTGLPEREGAGGDTGLPQREETDGEHRL